MMGLGPTLKGIRKSKNLSQKKITGSRFTQATYSNYENGISDISSTNLIYILEQLTISLEELKYIANDYQIKMGDKLINKFFDLPFNNFHLVSSLIIEIDQYLKSNENITVLTEIKLICEAMLILIDKGDFKKARLKVMPVWERMSKYDQYYLVDIQMLNVILYIFPFETSENIFKTLIRNLLKYQELKESKKIKKSLVLNFSMLLILNERYKDASKLLEQLLNEDLKSMSYTYLAICLNRLAIINTFESPNEVHFFLKKRDSLLVIYKDYDLEMHLKNEFERLKNKDNKTI